MHHLLRENTKCGRERKGGETRGEWRGEGSGRKAEVMDVVSKVFGLSGGTEVYDQTNC